MIMVTNLKQQKKNVFTILRHVDTLQNVSIALETLEEDFLQHYLLMLNKMVISRDLK